MSLENTDSCEIFVDAGATTFLRRMLYQCALLMPLDWSVSNDSCFHCGKDRQPWPENTFKSADVWDGVWFVVFRAMPKVFRFSDIFATLSRYC